MKKIVVSIWKNLICDSAITHRYHAGLTGHFVPLAANGEGVTSLLLRVSVVFIEDSGLCGRGREGHSQR